MRGFIKNSGVALLFVAPMLAFSQKKLVLENDNLYLEWVKTSQGYEIKNLSILNNSSKLNVPGPSGKYNLIFSTEKPNETPDWASFDEGVKDFTDSSYILIYKRWHQNLSPVALNTAGENTSFFPQKATLKSGKAMFEEETSNSKIHSTWELDKKYGNDILVTMELTALSSGYFSLATPSIATVDEKQLAWGMIPGHFQGNALQSDLVLGYAYGQGIPNRPVIVRERSATTLSPLIMSKSGVTLAVIPEPGTGRDPWADSVSTHNKWNLGLSVMTRDHKLSPTAYHPILGQDGSYLKKGEKITFSFRYTVKKDDWYDVYKHAIYDVYKFNEFLPKKETKKSLIERVWGMYDYVRNNRTSLWHTYQYQGKEIGAQEYNGPIYGKDNDAVKNSDYGAMWMLANLTQDSILLNQRLPYAKNFKLVQQELKDDFFKGAAAGQYYLWKSQRFTEEWGNYAEPIALTYYVMLDIGNILLFEPKNENLKERLRLGAERLLDWQMEDGSWVVGYDHASKKSSFQDLQDLRPTFYGLMVAYRILGDKKYLDAAVKGADWFIKNAVDKGHFLGVCGDFRFVPDFATGQSAQALLDLYDLTQNDKYKDAAIRTARMYTASVYTQPIPTNQIKYVKGKAVKDWEISQVGLSFEHGGTLGSSAKHNGPILLASHAGMFLRMYSLTKDSLFLDMARAGVWGRDAFVNQENQVASYYWGKMDDGPGSFPHHAWWQVGWIVDYLASEIEVRSNSQIHFPRGFITPKVGPHQSYGFDYGKVFGQEAKLMLNKGAVNTTNPYIEYLSAVSKDKKRWFIMLLNDNDNKQQFELSLNVPTSFVGNNAKIKSMNLIDTNGKRTATRVGDQFGLAINPFGMQVLEVIFE